MKRLILKLKMIRQIFSLENNLLISFEYSKTKGNIIYIPDTDFREKAQKQVIKQLVKQLDSNSKSGDFKEQFKIKCEFD